MCGRAILTSSVEDIVEMFGVAPVPFPAPRFNVAPTQDMAIVRPSKDDAARPELSLVRWGLVPWWSKDPKVGSRFLQARAETVPTSPAYRAAFKSKRCLVVVDGFYEWSGEKKHRQAHAVRLPNARPFAIAGLWDSWKTPEGERLETCAVVTTASRGALAAVHDRMPLVLDEQARERWLTGDPDEARALLDAPSPLPLVVLPVSSYVNDVRHEGPECLDRPGQR
ncbi:MAG: hypothetical protein JWP97_2507 [Labilithrix sp.]|nr:hypothetical protein [Labilithrix sp.]